MSVKELLEYANLASLAICLACIIVMWRKRALTDFKVLMAFLICEAASLTVSIPLLFFRRYTGISKPLAIDLYFYSSWFFFVVESAILIAIVYGVFHMAMRPLKGLHQMGKLAFRWVTAVALVLSVALGLGPHLSTPGYTATLAWVAASSHIQQAISILTLCLLLFVCFAVKPLGLTFRSRIFGVSLGLGVYATVQLISGAWTSASGAESVYSPMSLLNAVGAFVCYFVWTIYFALPEPERKMILLPTTSPYFFWNAVSEALGDAPGHVVVGGVTPAMFGQQELNVFTGQASLDAVAKPEAFDQAPLEAAPVRDRHRPSRQLATIS